MAKAVAVLGVFIVNLVLVASTGAAVIHPAPVDPGAWVSFAGVIVASLITAGVSFLAWRTSKKQHSQDEDRDANAAILHGFNDLTQRLQEQLASQDQKLQKIGANYDRSVSLLQGEIDECNRDRVDLRKKLEESEQDRADLRRLMNELEQRINRAGT